MLERRDRSYVEGRIRAGVLEPGTVEFLERAGVAGRLHREGLPHDGFRLALDGEELFRIDARRLSGRQVAPLCSFVAEPMRYGRLFLVGDAAHTVPPTGAEGLNLATSDVGMLAEAPAGHCLDLSSGLLDSHSARTLARVWKAERFSWWLTGLTHRLPDMDAFARGMQVAEMDHIFGSEAAQAVMAENHAGLPMGDPLAAAAPTREAALTEAPPTG